MNKPSKPSSDDYWTWSGLQYLSPLRIVRVETIKKMSKNGKPYNAKELTFEPSRKRGSSVKIVPYSTDYDKIRAIMFLSEDEKNTWINIEFDENGKVVFSGVKVQ